MKIKTKLETKTKTNTNTNTKANTNTNTNTNTSLTSMRSMGNKARKKDDTCTGPPAERTSSRANDGSCGGFLWPMRAERKHHDA